MDGQRQDLIIGKEDGIVEIYTVAEDDTAILVGVFVSLFVDIGLLFQNADESITSVSCGKISSPTHDEIIVCTCTGRSFYFR